jgi:hypothetical protein
MLKKALIVCFLLQSIIAAKSRAPQKWLHNVQRPQRTITKTAPNVLNATPSLIDAGEEVTVSWNGIKYKKNDIVAIYCPFDRTNSISDFIDALDVGQNNQTTGSGSLVFSPLINMRCVYGFRYLQQDSTGNWISVAESNPVKQRRPNVPQYGHIALGSNIHEMRVMWTSPSKYVPMVKYGPHPTRLTSISTGRSTTYTADMMCGAPANITSQQQFIDPGFQNDVLLRNLKPGTTYYYIYGSDNETFSDISHFTTPQGVGPNFPVKFVAYGDLGIDQPPAALSTVAKIAENLDEYNFIIHYGDISYAMGQGSVWEVFFWLIEPIARRVPYMISIGNHEYDHTTGADKDPSGAGLGFHPSWGNYHDDSAGECSVPMYYRFHMPDNGKAIYWYSFDYGNVHMLVMSTEHDYTPSSEQYKWMEKDLQSVDRTRTPWLIVAGHRPLYTSENCSDDPSASDFYVSLEMQKAFEDLLYQYKVDIGLWGHQHSFEMTCPVYRQQCVDDGIVHLVAGNAGASLEPGQFDMGNARTWSKFHWVNWGFLTLETDTSGHLTVKLLSNEDNSIVTELHLKSRF